MSDGFSKDVEDDPVEGLEMEAKTDAASKISTDLSFVSRKKTGNVEKSGRGTHTTRPSSSSAGTFLIVVYSYRRSCRVTHSTSR